MRLVLLGPPGAGKGTLAALLKETIEIKHISTGDILREEMKNNTELGQEAKKFIESGQLVPDEVVTRLIESTFVNNKDIGSYLLDGFPRTKAQAEDLDQMLEKVGKPIEFAIYMEASLPILIKRLTGRRICKGCGAIFHVENNPPQNEGICDECQGEVYQRADDNQETIEKRMEVYLGSTIPIVDYYKGQSKLKKISGDDDSQAVQKALMAFLDENKKSN